MWGKWRLRATGRLPSLLPCASRPPAQGLHTALFSYKVNFPTKRAVGTRFSSFFFDLTTLLLAFMLRLSTFKTKDRAGEPGSDRCRRSILAPGVLAATEDSWEVGGVNFPLAL